jgi:hypothetical protein
MDIKLRGRSRDNGKDLFYHNAIAEIYHHVKDGCLMGFAGYDQITEKPILLDIELWTGFTDGGGNELWEHDTVKYPAWSEYIFTIIWDEAKGCWSLSNGTTCLPMAPVVADLALCGV